MWLMVSSAAVLSGHIGHFQWNATVASCSEPSKADVFPLLALTTLLCPWLSWPKFELFTHALNRYESSHPKILLQLMRYMSLDVSFFFGCLEMCYMIISDQSCVLLLPYHTAQPLELALHNKVLASLATHYNSSVATLRNIFRVDLTHQYAKVRHLEGGDEMRASSFQSKSLSEDRHDATFVRVSHICLFFNLPLAQKKSMMFWLIKTEIHEKNSLNITQKLCMVN